MFKINTAKISSNLETFEAIAEVAEKLENLEPCYTQIGEYALVRVDDSFKNETDAYGIPFKPLNSEYRDFKLAKLKGIDKTLQSKGNLRSRFVYVVSDDGVEVGTNVIYAAVHQFGATIRPKKAEALVFRVGNPPRVVKARSVTIPARPVLPTDGLPADYEADVQAIFDDYIGEGL
jgi:phage gpG-like protein